jgi:hypothetical protein
MAVRAPSIRKSPEVTGARLRKGAGRARRPQASDDRLLRPYRSPRLRCRFVAFETPGGRLAALDFSHRAPRVAADDHRVFRVNQPALVDGRTTADPGACGFGALGSATSVGRREPLDRRSSPLAPDPDARLR